MLKSALWAGLLGMVVNAAAKLAHDLGTGRAAEPEALLLAAVFFPICCLHGLVIAALLKDWQAPRWQRAAVGLPSGALLMLSVPLAVIGGLLGWNAIAELFSFRDPAGNGFVVQCAATGAASALGAVIGLKPKENR